jgi:hypothetical protein
MNLILIVNNSLPACVLIQLTIAITEDYSMERKNNIGLSIGEECRSHSRRV